MDVDIESGEEAIILSYSVYDVQTLKHHKMFYVHRDYITVGYRACPNMTVSKCTRSLFQLHNETTNVWSHLIPAIYFTHRFVTLLVEPQ